MLLSGLALSCLALVAVSRADGHPGGSRPWPTIETLAGGPVADADREACGAGSSCPGGNFRAPGSRGLESGRDFDGEATQAWLWHPKAIALDPKWPDAGVRIFLADTNVDWRNAQPNHHVGGTQPRVRAFVEQGSIKTIIGNDLNPTPQAEIGENSAQSTPAGEAALASLFSVAFDKEGSLFIGKDSNVVKVPRKKNGPGSQFTSQDLRTDFRDRIGYRVYSVKGSIAQARALAFDQEGALFVAEGGIVVRIDPGPDGVVDGVARDSQERETVVAGIPQRGGYSADSVPATTSLLWSPLGLSFDRGNSLLIADTCNRRIRKVETGAADRRVDGDADELISTLAGRGLDPFANSGGPGADGCPGGDFNEGEGIEDHHPPASEGAEVADLNGPVNVLEDPAGNIFFTDLHNNRIRKIAPDTHGTLRVETVAGCGPVPTVSPGGGGFAQGCASANDRLHAPFGLAIGACPDPDLFVSEFRGNRVRRISGVASCSAADLSIQSFVAEKTGVTAGEKVPLIVQAANLGPDPAQVVKLTVTNKGFSEDHSLGNRNPSFGSYGSPRLEGREGACETLPGGSHVECTLQDALPARASVTLRLDAMPMAPGDWTMVAEIGNAAPADNVTDNDFRELTIAVGLPPLPEVPSIPEEIIDLPRGESPAPPIPGSEPPAPGSVDPNQGSITLGPPSTPGSSGPSTVAVSAPASQPFPGRVPLTGSLGFQPGAAEVTAPSQAAALSPVQIPGVVGSSAMGGLGASPEEEQQPAAEYSMVSKQAAPVVGLALTGSVLLVMLACVMVISGPPFSPAPAWRQSGGSRSSRLPVALG